MRLPPRLVDSREPLTDDADSVVVSPDDAMCRLRGAPPLFGGTPEGGVGCCAIVGMDGLEERPVGHALLTGVPAEDAVDLLRTRERVRVLVVSPATHMADRLRLLEERYALPQIAAYYDAPFHGHLMVTVERSVIVGRDLRESVALLKESQAIGHVGSWRYDENADTLTCSEEVYRIFGRDPGEESMTYRSFLESIHPDDRAAADAAFRSSSEQGRGASETTHRIIRADDNRVRVVSERFARVDEPGREPHSVGFLQD